uniref:Uncharacterized protein n=1 Tax=Cacopsylla melanoneura TaxID=428564 RepID=A0A8D9F7U8_9HEMI
MGSSFPRARKFKLKKKPNKKIFTLVLEVLKYLRPVSCNYLIIFTWQNLLYRLEYLNLHFEIYFLLRFSIQKVSLKTFVASRFQSSQWYVPFLLLTLSISSLSY